MSKQRSLFGYDDDDPPDDKGKGFDPWENGSKKMQTQKEKIDALFNEPPPGRARAIESMNLVTENADKKQLEESEEDEAAAKLKWSLSVRSALELWCRLKGPGHRFKTEDFWYWGESGEFFKEPHNRKAYGSIMSAAAKDSKKYGAQIIKWVGYDTAENPRGHAHPVALWEVA